ncbi:MAG: tetraacyldisaccharide 4'-kinase [Methylophilaceae bacterium]
MVDRIRHAWKVKNAFFYVVLTPLSWVFGIVTALRRQAYSIGVLPSTKLPVPVIIVGNINMGGSGKTPVVLWLVEQLRNNGYTPGVISRGYGGVNNMQPISVHQDSLASQVGDEPLLIAKRTGTPVWIGRKRVDVGSALLKANPECDVIVSDDGLQHYWLKRDIEIAVVDSESTSAHYLLPAGPLREPRSRLQTVDFIICNGEKTITQAFNMQLRGQTFYNLANPQQTVEVDYFTDKSVKALAGIGKPERFFWGLTNLGLDFEGVSFDDHHAFTTEDLESITCDALVMTEKDAVKCQPFAQKHHWVLPVEAEIEATLLPQLLAKLKKT